MRVNSRLIRDVVCEYFRVSRPQMQSIRRSDRLSMCRDMISFLCCQLTSEDYPSIGATMWRSHYMVRRSEEAVYRLLERDPRARELVALLKGRIREECTKKITAGLAAQGAGNEQKETALHAVLRA